MLGCVCFCASSTSTPPVLGGAHGACVWVRALSVTQPILAGALGCVCFHVRSTYPANPGWGVRWWFLSLGFGCQPANPDWGVWACVFLCALRLHPASPGWGVPLGRTRDRGAGKEDTTAGTRAHTQKGHATTEGPARPHARRTPRDPWRRTLPTHAAKARIGRRTDHTGSRPPATRNHTGEGGHTHTGRKVYTNRGSRREHHRAAHHHALTARRRSWPEQGPPHRQRKGKGARPQRPGLEARTPDDTGPKHRPQGGQQRGHLPDPSARIAHQDPHSTDPASHPAPSRTPQPPASHTPIRTPHHDTGWANLHRSTTAKHEAARHTAAQRTTVERIRTRQPKTQTTTARRDTTRHSAAHHSTTRRHRARPSRAHRNTAQTSTT